MDFPSLHLHKKITEVPLPPIVSAIFSNIWTDQTLNDPHNSVKNLKHFVDILKNIEIMDLDILVSFDVESLFTKISVKGTLNLP